MYIERQLEKKFAAVSEEYACVLLTGPRQVGKSTMLRHLMEGTARAEVSLDNLEERRLAKTDPAMFLKLHPAPVLIDEVQYAPELFSYIKIAVDNGAAPGSYWLTGSQAYRLMELQTSPYPHRECRWSHPGRYRSEYSCCKRRRGLYTCRSCGREVRHPKSFGISRSAWRGKARLCASAIRQAPTKRAKPPPRRKAPTVTARTCEELRFVRPGFTLFTGA